MKSKNEPFELDGAMLQQIINAITGDEAVAEVVVVPEGDSIERIIAARKLKPVGDVCGSCGVHHFYENEAGEQVALMPVKADHPPEKKKNFEDHRQGALEGIRIRQVKVLRMYDLLKEMEKSISERGAEDVEVGNLIDDITRLSEMRRLARELS